MELKGAWRVFPIPLLGANHVIPVNDLIQHELREDCVCLPRIEVVSNPGCPDLHLYTHSSLDGRELHE